MLDKKDVRVILTIMARQGRKLERLECMCYTMLDMLSQSQGRNFQEVKKLVDSNHAKGIFAMQKDYDEVLQKAYLDEYSPTYVEDLLKLFGDNTPPDSPQG